ncbi:hypothetical protein L9F63_008985 [Diploptera punctata]|uniref:Receptor ligand binding region domain-containing protein n=1 Tax=Diploptera punctata TaxID=6984 RepID=A0AAD8E1W3_DIPPU|nr:hypothetical protein L9F63_008985 [Diploptera punctata]
MEVAKASFVLTWLFLCHGCSGSLSEELCKASKSIINTPGDANVIGIFKSHGPNCSERDRRELHYILSAVQILQTLNEQNFVPGIKIGMQLYDICMSPLSVKQTLVHSLVEMECNKAYSLGNTFTPSSIMMSPAVSSQLYELISSLNVSVTHIHPQHCVLAANLTVSLLSALNWTQVHFVFAQELQFMKSFVETANNENICIKHQIQGQNLDKILVDTTNSTGLQHVAVVFGSISYMLQIIQSHQINYVNSSIQWVYVMADMDHEFNVTENLPNGTVLLAPKDKRMKIIEENTEYLKNENFSTLMHNVSTNYNDTAITSSPFFLDVAYSFNDISCKLRSLAQQYCQSQKEVFRICQNIPSFFQINISHTIQDCQFKNNISRMWSFIQ